jgi:hypothetical protein
MRVTGLVLALVVVALSAADRERSFSFRANKSDKTGDMARRALVCKRGDGARQCTRGLMARLLLSGASFFF